VETHERLGRVLGVRGEIILDDRRRGRCVGVCAVPGELGRVVRRLRRRGRLFVRRRACVLRGRVA
jgi:hypothetical protein